MLLSQKNNILFIANPKTATTSIQKWLQSQDSSYVKTNHTVNDKSIVLREHITANDAKKILGKEFYNKLHTIGFIRNPENKLISAYKFYRQAGKNKKLWDEKTHDKKKRIMHVFQYTFARVFPFKIWALMYPYKDNYRYFKDENNEIIVSNIGRFENLIDDLKTIVSDLNLNYDVDRLNVVNKSNSLNKKIYIKPWFLKVLMIRHSNLKKDIQFYNEISNRFSQ